MGIFSRIKSALWNTEDGRYSLFRSVGGISFGDGRNMRKLLSYNDINLYVNRGVDKRAEKVSEIVFQLKKRGTNEDATDKEAQKWLDLLNKPNKMMTGKQFWKLAQTYKDVTGSCFILKVSAEAELFKPEAITELHLLRPDLVTVNLTEDGKDIKDFSYKPENGKETTYTKDQVIYLYTPDTLYPYKGASILKAGIRNIETDIQLTEYQAKVLKNGGRIEGVFKFTNPLNKEQLKTLKESYKEEYSEAQKAGIPLFLGGGAEYNRVSLSPNELAYIESRGASIKDISALTGVPLALLGLTSGETFANADASIAIFLRETVKPLMTELNDVLDWRLVPDTFDLTFIDPTPEDVDRKIKIAKAGYETDSMSINERREVLGLGALDVDGADDIFVSFNKTPLGQETSTPTKSVKKKSFTHPLADNDFRKKYGEIQAKRLDARETKFAQAIRQYFAGQESRIIESLEGKKQFKKKGLIDEIFNERLEVKLASGVALPLLRSFLADAGKDATDLVEYPVGFNMTSQIEKWLSDRADLFGEQINDTTFKNLKSQFEQSFEAGETRQELIGRIKDVYAGYDDNRAKTIARTEVHGAVQKGTIEGYDQAGVPTKIWVWAPGVNGGVRHDHQNMDGVEVPIKQDFQLPSGATCDFPGNTGDAAEDINCSCSI